MIENPALQLACPFVNSVPSTEFLQVMCDSQAENFLLDKLIKLWICEYFASDCAKMNVLITNKELCPYLMQRRFREHHDDIPSFPCLLIQPTTNG